MEEMVTVVLDRRRPYRVRQTDRTAIWVGPGPVQVPRWVAENWRMEFTPVRAPEPDAPKVPSAPWDGYDDQSAAEIIARLADLTATERAIVAAYEQRNKQRKTVLDAAQAEEA